MTNFASYTFTFLIYKSKLMDYELVLLYLLLIPSIGDNS